MTMTRSLGLASIAFVTIVSLAVSSPGHARTPGLHAQTEELGGELPGEVSRVFKVFEAVRGKALERSYDLRIAEASARQSGASLFTAWTRWAPRIDLSLTQSRARDFSIITSGAIGQFGFNLEPQVTSLSRWDLDLSFPVYRRAVHVGIDQASAETDLARERLRSRRAELDWRLRQLLGNALLQSYKVATLGNSIELARTNLRETELRFELGQRTRVDVLKSRANVLSLDSKRVQYDENRVAAVNELSEYAGISPQELLATGIDELRRSEQELFGAIRDFSEAGPVLDALRTYLEGNAAAVESEKRAAASSAVYASIVGEETLSVRKARSLNSAEFPELLLRGSVNKQAMDWSEALRGGNVSYSLALVLNVPIFSGGSSFSSAREKNRAQEAAGLKAEKDLVRFRSDLETDRSRIVSLRTRLEALELNREQNEEIVRLSQKSFQLGKASLLELLTAQDDLFEAKINLAQARIDLGVLARKYAWNIGVSPE